MDHHDSHSNPNLTSSVQNHDSIPNLWTLQVEACRQGDLRKLIELFDKEQDEKNNQNKTTNQTEIATTITKTTTYRGPSLLHWAALATSKESIDVVKYLIGRGLPVNNVDIQYGMSPIQTAICHNSIKMVDVFIQNGATITSMSKDHPDQSDLILAKMHNKFATFAHLLESGADIKQCDNKGNTILHFIASTLIDDGSSFAILSLYHDEICNIKNASGMSAVDIGLKSNRMPILYKLRSAGCEMKFSDKYNRNIYAHWFEDYFTRQNNLFTYRMSILFFFYISCMISFFTYRVSMMMIHPKFYLTLVLIHFIPAIVFHRSLRKYLQRKQLTKFEILPLSFTINYIIYSFLESYKINNFVSRFISYSLITCTVSMLLFYIYTFIVHNGQKRLSKHTRKEKENFRSSVIKPKIDRMIKSGINDLTGEREFIKGICCYCLKERHPATFHCSICNICVPNHVGHSDYLNYCVDRTNLICVILFFFSLAALAIGMLLYQSKFIFEEIYKNYLEFGLLVTLKNIISRIKINNIVFILTSIWLIWIMPLWISGLDYRP